MTPPPADADKTGEGTVCAKCETTDVFYIQSIADLTARLVKEEARAARMEEALREAKKLPLVRCLRCNGKAEVEEDMLLGGLIMDKIDEALSPKDGR